MFLRSSESTSGFSPAACSSARAALAALQTAPAWETAWKSIRRSLIIIIIIIIIIMIIMIIIIRILMIIIILIIIVIHNMI